MIMRLKPFQQQSSMIIKQDLTNGIPYSAFHEPLRESIENKSILTAMMKEVYNEID